MEILHADSTNFEEVVLRSEKTVLLDFYARWCGPCKMLGKELEEMTPGEGYSIVKVDIDQNPDLARQWKVQSVPTLFVIKNGASVDSITGFLPKEELEKRIKKA